MKEPGSLAQIFCETQSETLVTLQALRFKKAHVTHPELKATFCLPIIGVKKNPSSPMYTGLGVITKGTVIEVRAPFYFTI